MKKIFEDFQKEGFTKKEIVWYGILWPLGLLLCCGLIEGLFNS